MRKRIALSTHAFSLREMFMKFKSKKLGILLPHGSKLNYTIYCRALAARVFAYAFITMLDDVIDNNVVFMLPTKYESFIEVLKIDTDEFEAIRKLGGLKDIDLLKSSFHGVRLQYRYKTRTHYTIKLIIVDSKRKQRLYNNLYNKKY